jgi:hypothetical protein
MISQQNHPHCRLKYLLLLDFSLIEVRVLYLNLSIYLSIYLSKNTLSLKGDFIGNDSSWDLDQCSQFTILKSGT